MRFLYLSLVLSACLFACAKKGDVNILQPLNQGVVQSTSCSDLMVLVYRSELIKDGFMMGGVSVLQRKDEGFYPSFVGTINPDWQEGNVCLVWMVDAKPTSVQKINGELVLKNIQRVKGLWFGWFSGLNGDIKSIQTEILDKDSFSRWEQR